MAAQKNFKLLYSDARVSRLVSCSPLELKDTQVMFVLNSVRSTLNQKHKNSAALVLYF